MKKNGNFSNIRHSQATFILKVSDSCVLKQQILHKNRNVKIYANGQNLNVNGIFFARMVKNIT
ncbi:hypothetical protein CCAND93_840003 [Capnocytophaga canis]|uniref:Uncharacterized protein n=1 Tax=Capnocytophaga canis TaxID=1848903 RepID=A0A0B7IUL3_9FLAO|nr:hypothetical protein CCAND93_840003 [Capnocytophaga canis]